MDMSVELWLGNSLLFSDVGLSAFGRSRSMSNQSIRFIKRRSFSIREWSGNKAEVSNGNL